jgi:hypothetical protein
MSLNTLKPRQMKRKRIVRKKNDDSQTNDPTETNMEPGKKNNGEEVNKEDADNTGTDTDSDATESQEEKLKRPGRFDKDKREVDPDMTEEDSESDKTNSQGRAKRIKESFIKLLLDVAKRSNALTFSPPLIEKYCNT